MQEIILSGHTRDMLKERNIPEEWVMRTINEHDWEYTGEDKNIHYFKSIPEYGGRILHVIINPYGSPQKVVTVFFDRRARRKE
ncbi:MAG: DUF4258 domain-containing protein [Nitrospirota bacterium]